MKKIKKIMALMVAMVMVLAMSSLTAFAAGTNSITVSGAQNGEKYNIYKMLDLSVGLDAENKPNAYRYTINSKWENFWTTGAGSAYIDTNTAGSDTYVVWKESKKTPAEMEAFGKAAAAWAKNNNITADATEVIAANSTASWSGLDNGYYLVTSTYGIATAVASTPANPAQKVFEKNNANTTEKKVQENAERNGAQASWGTSNDAQVGDTITFRSKVSIARNSVNVVYHDTMENGLDFSGVNNVKVYTDENCSTELSTANYSVTTTVSGETFQVVFSNEYVAALTASNTDLYVKYTAVLNDNAVVGTSVKNSGIVKWGDNGASSVTETTTDTHKFTILKYDGTDTLKQPLAGAKFQLFTTASGGTALTLAKNNDGTIYRIVDMTDSGASLPTGYTLVTDNKIETLSNSVITIEGVDSDDYYLEETDAPKGYNKLTDRTKVEVNVNNQIQSEIANNSGNTLPSTGGIGTTIFYVLGGILVLGAAILLITRKRMNAVK